MILYKLPVKRNIIVKACRKKKKSAKLYVLTAYDEVIVVDLMQNSNIIVLGFLVWLFIAPRRNSSYGELFLAYMTTLLCSLVGSSEIMMVKPVAFFFTIGGVLAFIYVVVRKTVRIAISK